MSKKTRYIFDATSLSFKKKNFTIKEKLKHVSFGVAFGLVLSVTMVLIIYYFIDSPKEKILKRQVSSYERQYNSLNKQIDNLSDMLIDVENRDKEVYRVIFEVEPTQIDLEYQKQKDKIKRERQSFSESDLISLTKEKINLLEKRLFSQEKSLKEILQIAKNKKERMVSMPAILPISKNKSKLVSGFGNRFHPILQIKRMHSGIDFSAPTGTEVYATANGQIEDFNMAGSGYGLAIVINHGFGYETLYAHLSKILVKPGDKVVRGDIIGLVGSTGLTQAPHLHYEVHKNQKPVNPVYYFFNDLTIEEYEKVIEKSQEENQSLS
ncbi:MAG: M23 family metallopeptidase [Bacteroidales bacterium]|jgi:murein DD-endopeptidase MepM/ murein hydrolase activator NlpD|nr:M23 family metallopeptidase [Bacteroidales bacterium]